MTKVAAPAFRYHGGMFRVSPWVNQHLPAHRIYVEPFGGAAGVLLTKPRSGVEIYNDLDGEVVA
ncbi:DNA adenine methylase [Stenotrophomonas maltophilia]|uniref:DNA adenine methylase n=1 Tax=Stenotrophomonas TaxID=40323 RepID=UPI0004EF51B6|nr:MULTISPECIES: DNA adenine methylase [Stenotrophomonas]AIL08886.1 putative n6 adenine-specific dna methyltransferase domain protein [Stenotrophomonas maltophilia]QQA82825.1 DNA adenine methylase [Stenotrophomonas maltophilia]WQE24014.1 DNA adenine methylase [Stenotrophomonas maltophilia]SNW04828.1 Site-specific DNA methylase [Stenotrophomonas maltophilia]HDS1015803.1 DNA adenine methylase [Stenotrophomonas maltophilia]